MRAVVGFSAADLTVSGGSVASITPVNGTTNYLVWVQATYGIGALGIAIKAGGD